MFRVFFFFSVSFKKKQREREFENESENENDGVLESERDCRVSENGDWRFL